MTVIQNLDQHYIDNQLRCPDGKVRDEIVDPQRTGLYIEVRAGSPGAGTYYLRYKQSGKTRHEPIGRTTAITLEDARKAAAHFKSAISQRAHGTPVNTPPQATAPSAMAVVAGGLGRQGMSLDTFMEEYYFPHAKVHKRSCSRDEQLYHLRIKARFGHLPLALISRHEVQRFHNGLLPAGLSEASANHHAQLLRRVCNLAVSWEMLDKNVLARIPLFTLDNQVEHYLDDAQVNRLVAVLKADKNRMVCLILMFLLATGARLNEALCAKWNQVDVPNKGWRIPAKNSKSKKVKSLPLNTSALWVLEQLTTRGDSEFLFPSPITGKSFVTITRVWYRLRAEAGLPDNVRIHDLRHTFASRMVSAGRSLFDVQQLLGHADARTSQRYAHLSMQAKQEASNAAAFSC